ncbi:unnamed protein product [Clonostachys rosea f. rosea IK726]|uniref:Uncharacterized protein n=1 Tax=Clonostachys rosea f. rosea IK726 TaxID=1349383 RepID=A0ACA9TCI0_BIOOC|nr:unnamed protein product [Clonostachys rosea f. rosea IK726]
MVNIAIAGGAGNVGREIIDALVAANKHEILILSRKEAPATPISPGVKWAQVSYDNVDELTRVLEGIDTMLSFIAEPYNPGSAKPSIQRILIDASVKAGVRRFAPSEWATSHFDGMHWYSFKNDTRNYLAELNKDKKVIEYSLFIPGLFTNYLTFPFRSSKHVELFEMPIDFYRRRILTLEGHEDDTITLTTTQDMAKVVARAVDYEGEWPVFGGIVGSNITISQLIALGEKIRGPFEVEKLSLDDLKAGAVKASWLPKVTHPAIPVEQRESAAGALLTGVLLGIHNGCWKATNNAWNELLPDIELSRPEDWLVDAWAKIDGGAQSVHADE